MYGKGSSATVLDRYRHHADAFEALLAGTTDDGWDAPSPCEGWRARDVVAHLVDLGSKLLRDRAGVQPTGAPSVVDDPAAAFRAMRADVERVLEDPATPPKLVGDIDAVLSFDIAQHGWDLAMATGQDATIDPAFVQTAWDMLSPLGPDWSRWQRDSTHAYGPAVPVPNDAPLQHRLLGLIGRDPNWTADQSAGAPNTSVLVRSLTHNFEHALSAIETAIADCPDNMWETDLWPDEARQGPLKRADGRPWGLGGSAPWNLAHHALTIADYDLTGDFEPWVPPPPFDEHEGGHPTCLFTKTELLGYVDWCRGRVRQTLNTFTEEVAARPLPSAHRYRGMLFGVIVGATPMHIRDHASQIRQFLTAAGVKPQSHPE